MDNPVMIFGAGGLGRAALEIFESNGNVVYGFLDDNKKIHDTQIDDIPVLGNTSNEEYLKIIGGKCEAFIALDENSAKKSLVKTLMKDRKKMPVNAVHNNASLSRSCEIGHGNFINDQVTIGAGAKVGSHCMINSGAVVDHSSHLNDFVQIGVGAMIGAHVTLEEGVFVGSGAIIVSGVTLEKGARVGAGSVVISDVDKNQTVFGNPAVNVKK